VTAILESLSELITKSGWLAPLLALIAGILTSFTPCSLSSIPLVIGYVGGVGRRDTKRAFWLSITFAAGAAVTFTTLGVIASIAGRLMGTSASWWYIILGVLMILMALQTWGIFEIVPSSYLISKNTKKGFIGAFIAGILGGIFSSPCSTPVLIALLAIVAGKGSILWGILLLLLYSIGHGILAIIAGTSMPADSVARRELRPYQDSIVKKVVETFDEGGKKAFYIVATGLGKTVIAATIARRLWERGCRRILVLCHQTDLAQQLEQGFWPQLTKEIPTSVFFDGIPPRDTEGISFGLYQSLYGYLPGIEEGRFDVVIVDEAHHAMAYGFRACLDHLKPRFLIGMTATPWRGDGQNLNAVFGEPLAKVSLVDGMAMGYLSKVDYRIFCDNVNWDEMQNISKKKLSIRDLNKRLFLPQRDEAVIAEIQKVVKTVPNPKIAIFSPSIEHSNRFAAMLSAAGIPTAALSISDKAERRKRLLGFSAGNYSAVTAVDVMNEGIDIPDVNILVPEG
jgi:cytochrome c biogenesis protein CcdA